MSTIFAELDRQLVDTCIERIAADLGIVLGRELSVLDVTVAREKRRRAVGDDIHVSFKFGVQVDRELKHGAFVMPLDAAIASACWMVMMSEEATAARRAARTVDGRLKDLMLELGHVISSSLDRAFRAVIDENARIRSESCQGVAKKSRPSFDHPDSEPLLVMRARATFRDASEEFDLLLMLPVFDPDGVLEA